MRAAILVALIVSMTSVAKADIEVTDGGYRVTAYHPDGTSGTVKRDSFTVRGTGTYADEAVDIANRKSTERAKEFEKTMDRLIGCSLRPACPPPRPIQLPGGHHPPRHDNCQLCSPSAHGIA